MNANEIDHIKIEVWAKDGRRSFYDGRLESNKGLVQHADRWFGRVINRMW